VLIVLSSVFVDYQFGPAVKRRSISRSDSSVNLPPLRAR
jgi:hypothetical protein